MILRPVEGDEAARTAARLIEAFRSIGAVLSASDVALDATVPERPEAVSHLGAIREGLMHALRAQILSEPVLSTSRAVTDYLFATMAHLRTEQVHVLFLDPANRLVADEPLSHGSTRDAVMPAHEILRRAVALSATALILAHNHPSGELRPSAADLAATNRLARMAASLDIRLHDHLIVARTGVLSFRALGLIEGAPGAD
jgi:DNA repair protein RadC